MLSVVVAGVTRTSCGWLAEIDQPGANLSEVARRHDVSVGLVWQWRRQLRQSRLVLRDQAQPRFIPLRVTGPQPEEMASPAASNSRIEITLPDGTRLWVGPDVDAASLAWGVVGAALVVPIPPGIRVWLATGHTDIRCGMNGLEHLPEELWGKPDKLSAGRFIGSGYST